MRISTGVLITCTRRTFLSHGIALRGLQRGARFTTVEPFTVSDARRCAGARIFVRIDFPAVEEASEGRSATIQYDFVRLH